MEFNTILADYGLDEKSYEACISDIQEKINGTNELEWQDIVEKYNLSIKHDTLRKACSSMPFGCKFVLDYFSSKKYENNDDYEEKMTELRKERQKIQSLNLERNRIDREESRHSLYFEYVRDVIQSLPVPDFHPVVSDPRLQKCEYVLCLSDIHYGATFKCQNNEYSPEICAQRFGSLLQKTIKFVKDRNVETLMVVSLGDDIQGLLRMSDVRLNDSSVVKSVVEISRLIAMFLNALSEYTYVDYYHVPTSNHSQNRNLGTKASELPWEDMEYIIGNYVKDLLEDNDRIFVTLANDGVEYIDLPIFNFNVVAMHGHQFKDPSEALKKMSLQQHRFIDALIIGHQHSSKELISYEAENTDAEVLVCPSFIGSDPYADKLMVGAKPAVKIFGFDSDDCHTETYKLLL